MPNHIQLRSKTTGEVVTPQSVDEALCKELEVPCDPVKWVYDWWDRVAFSLAMGASWESLRKALREEDTALGVKDEMMHLILDILERDYTPDAWATIGGRR